MHDIKTVRLASSFWSGMKDVLKKDDIKRIRNDIGTKIKSILDGEQVNDKKFNSDKWGKMTHVHLTDRDILFLERQKGGIITIAGFGDRKTYAYRGKGERKEQGTIKSLVRSAAAGGVGSPQWDFSKISWKYPSDLTENPMLQEMSESALIRLQDEVGNEGYSLEKFHKTYPRELFDDLDERFDIWVDSLEKAAYEVDFHLNNFQKFQSVEKKSDYFDKWLSPEFEP